MLYTADIERAKNTMSRTAVTIETEVAYLVGAPSQQWLEEAKRSIEGGKVSDEALMHLVLLPLTYKGREKKQKAVRECVHLARQIPEKGQETFALSGILSFTDKVIDEETRQYIKEVIGMTQVGKMLMDEGIQQGDMERAKRTALKMLKRGDSLNDVAEVLELPMETIKTWEKELCVVV